MIIAELSDSSGKPAMEIIQQNTMQTWQLDKMPLLQDCYKRLRFQSLSRLGPTQD
ncbi:hypothetical protein [Leptolyngbya sp. PCC 6406]|uniref:hypothetical protein n=1 Tax=Leptolyngbya sp. PCC 6406 TaxID=1173264 RepID=UPI0002DC7AB7|nr:hypothetical protein [Leptolyngbya sp. PCC 6406]